MQPLDIPVGHSHGGYLQSRRLGAPFPEDDPGSPFASLFPATRGMQSAPRAKALFLEDGRGRLVIASVDVAFITATLTSRVLHHVKQGTGLDLRDQLILQATHTHAGPGRFSDSSLSPRLLSGEPEGERHALAHGIDTFSPESTDRIARSVASAIVRARDQLEPARFGWARGENPDASRDRRCHDDWLYGKGDRDRTVTVLRVDRSEGGDPIAVLFHFAMHGTLYDWNNRHLSVDGPGHAEYAVERLFDRPMVAMYLQGAAATVSPSGDRAGHSGSQAMARIGWDLAGTVASLLQDIETEDRIDLQVEQRWVRVDKQSLGYSKTEFHEDGAMLCHFLDSSCPLQAKDPGALDCLGKGVEGGGKYQTRLVAARIGELALLTLPGEPTAAVERELARFANEAGFRDALILGYAQDHDGYILLEDDWLSGGSETNITFWGWRHGRYLVERSADLVQALAGDGRPSQGGFPAAIPGRDSFEAPPPTSPSFSYTAYVPTESDAAPAVIVDAPAEIERMDELRFAFHGGDPALGTPAVRIQRRLDDGSFSDVLLNGWIPLGNLHGPELPTFYESAPTWREAPDATPRAHRWEVIYEPPRDLPEGIYRLQVTAPAFVAGTTSTWQLDSMPFQVVPSTRLRTEHASADGILHITLLYPERLPIYSSSPRNADWQLGGFRPVDPRFRPEFVPVLQGHASAPIRVGDREVDMTFVERPLERDAAAPWPPGVGPSFDAPIGETERGAIEIPAGALCDRWGNCNAATGPR